MAATPRLALPFLTAGQAQKEFYHNEALQTLDMVAAAAVEDGLRQPSQFGGSWFLCAQNSNQASSYMRR